MTSTREDVQSPTVHLNEGQMTQSTAWIQYPTGIRNYPLDTYAALLNEEYGTRDLLTSVDQERLVINSVSGRRLTLEDIEGLIDFLRRKTHLLDSVIRSIKEDR